ncbi:MAG TPA: putative hydro-lyase [Acetobacteraceae bacterium]|jgi:uncharacterized protein YcsI (UPF0317 family)|nr:putative hydro-lyase [Acetobacteraceae bacterium]
MDDLARIHGTPADIRARARNGLLTGNTAALASGYVQANIAIVRRAHADAFADYCLANARACPLLTRSEPGDPTLPALGDGIDIRHDLPRYRVYRDGTPTEAFHIADVWRDDFVTFAIGCSFTFDNALLAEGVPLRHVALGRNIAMYRTDRDTVAVGRFGGKLVVSMRPFARQDAARAVAISAAFDDQHGAPVHCGDPAALGIADLQRTDYGDPVPVDPDDVTLFWACGVTSQTALQAAGLPLFISHAPGSMLVTDRRHGAAG